MNARTLPDRDHRDLAADMAKVRQVVRAHRPAPTVDVQIEYDAGADRDERGPYAWFHITYLRVAGRDIEPKLRKALGEDKFARLEAVIEEAMREAARDDNEPEAA